MERLAARLPGPADTTVQRDAETGSEGGGGGKSIMSGKVLITGRAGFIGSHVADISQARRLTGQIAFDRVDQATLELERRGSTL